MNDTDKLLLKIDGESLVNRTYRMHKEAGLEPILITGYAHTRLQEVFNFTKIQSVHNPNFIEGQQTSVLTGLNAISSHSDAVIISLADMPLLTSNDLKQLMNAYADRPAGCSATIPFNGENRGNPVIIDAALIRPIVRETGNTRAFLDKNPSIVHWYLNTSPGYYVDLDTLDDLETLQHVYGITAKGQINGQH